MKPDDFLKCKKARCVENRGRSLTIGKIYTILSVVVPLPKIKVENDTGANVEYDIHCFEPVIELAENPLQGVNSTPEFEAVEPVLVDNCQVNIQDIGTDILDTNADIKDTPKFKVGDKVYFGTFGEVKTVSEVGRDNDLELNGEIGWVSGDCCCHATQENYERLQATFPDIEFEAPAKPLSGDALVKAMLTKGIKNVLCLWGSGDKIIIDRLNYKGSLISADCRVVGGLTPIDWYTGEPLTEAVLDE